MDQPQTQLLHAFEKTEGEQIQIALRKYKGKFYIDLRLWYQKDKTGVFLPTKKGVFFSVDHAVELKRGVDQLVDAAAKILPQEATENLV